MASKNDSECKKNDFFEEQHGALALASPSASQKRCIHHFLKLGSTALKQLRRRLVRATPHFQKHKDVPGDQLLATPASIRDSHLLKSM